MSTTTNAGALDLAALEARHAERVGELERQLAAARADARRAQEAQRESELRHRFALKSAALGTWELSGADLVFTTDGRHDEILGLAETRGVWSYAELLARVFSEDRDHADRMLRRALKNASDVSFECRVLRVDGELRWIELHGSHLPLSSSDEREERRMIGVVADITARKRAQLDLVESRAELEQGMERLRALDRRKDEFLAVLGHELRNPLAALHNGVRLLQRADGDEDSGRWTRTMLDTQVRQLSRIVDDLLDVTRVRRGKVRLEKARLALQAVVEEAVSQTRSLLEERRHQLEVSLCGEELVVLADKARLAQVVANLLHNAARYTPPEGVVTVSLERDGPRARLVVSDTGAGLAPESLEEIFEPFAQVRGSTIAGGGLGIGLTIARELVGLHGGEIRAESEGVGCGSRFVVTLPLVERVRRSQERPPAPAVPDFRGGLRVLVVDDNSDAAMALGMLLDASSCVVETAFSGRTALEKARVFLPDVVLCDIGLPDLTGFDVAEALRADERTRAALLVAVTGFGHDDVAGRVRQSGFDLHLLKPVDPDVLFDLLAGARKTLLP